MRLIAHRGNTKGPLPEMENHPDYIIEALHAGYEVEIDVWYIDGKWLLGHDEPSYETSLTFLRQYGLWIHCKNYEALQELLTYGMMFNCFYHTDEDYVVTSRQYIWAYPGKPGGAGTICVMPEWDNQSIEGFGGVCSDYVEKYR